ncbi:MAG: nucleoside-diphosphate kinase [Anaerolineaceae bacterium]|jgi:nucleoside-diphosphate kinase
MERTLVLVKPDGVQRGLIGEITSRLERRGLKLVAAKFIKIDQQLAETHYAVHKGKPFYDGLVRYITASPVLAMVWEGPNAIAAVRQTMGATNPAAALPGTIRHDLAIQTSRNLTHASDSLENAASEIALWFQPDEIIDWERSLDPWLLDNN